MYYHGSKYKFDKFDAKFSKHKGLIYFTKCKKLAQIYAARIGSSGYLYTLKINDEHLIESIKSECGGCYAIDPSLIEIIDIETVHDDSTKFVITECGKTAIRERDNEGKRSQ